MSPEEVISHYNGKSNAANAISVSPSNITAWLKDGYIPISRQYEISRLSAQELKPDSVTEYMVKRGYMEPKSSEKRVYKPQPIR